MYTRAFHGLQYCADYEKPNDVSPVLQHGWNVEPQFATQASTTHQNLFLFCFRPTHKYKQSETLTHKDVVQTKMPFVIRENAFSHILKYLFSHIKIPFIVQLRF